MYTEFWFSAYILYFFFIFFFKFFVTFNIQFSFLIFWLNNFYFVYIFPKNFLYINNLLSNPIAYTHPVIFLFIFYFFITIIIVLFFYTYITFSILVNRTSTVIVWLLNFTLISFFLGCWWAHQESYWGGWWSWEISELLLLFFFNCLILSVHVSNQFYTYKLFFIYYFILFFFYFHLNSLNFYFSVNLHSFFSEVITLCSSQLLIFLLFWKVPIISCKKPKLNFFFCWPVQLLLFTFVLIKEVSLYYFLVNFYLVFVFYLYPNNHLLIFILLSFILYSSFFYLF